MLEYYYSFLKQMSLLLLPQQPNLDPPKICGTDNPSAFKHKKLKVYNMAKSISA
jgi:hypothetical protein